MIQGRIFDYTRSGAREKELVINRKKPIDLKRDEILTNGCLAILVQINDHHLNLWLGQCKCVCFWSAQRICIVLHELSTKSIFDPWKKTFQLLVESLYEWKYVDDNNRTTDIRQETPSLNIAMESTTEKIMSFSSDLRSSESKIELPIAWRPWLLKQISENTSPSESRDKKKVHHYWSPRTWPRPPKTWRARLGAGSSAPPAWRRGMGAEPKPLIPVVSLGK